MEHTGLNLQVLLQMKTILTITVFVLMSALSSRCADAPALSYSAWSAEIKKDSKFDVLSKRLGKPDNLREGRGYKIYKWSDKLDKGTTSPGDLMLMTSDYNDVEIVVGIFNPSTQGWSMFPWADKVNPLLIP